MSTVFAQTTEWPAYGNDPGGTRYSAAQSRSPEKRGDLKHAWIYNTGALSRAGKQKEKIAFEATPIFVDGTLYLSTPLNRVIALDPETGKRSGRMIPMLPLDAAIRK